MTCTCGHVEDEHDKYPCTIEGCDCIYFEWDGEEDEDGESE